MNILDDLNKIKEIDKAGMLEIEENFHSQLLDAKKIAEGADLKDLKAKEFRGIALLGMGGSGFSGDIVKVLVRDEIKIPVEIVKGYNLPAYIDSRWLVIPVSYSGNTEETISATSQALERGCEILVNCSGGKLEKIAEDNQKAMIKIPSGLQPRGANGYIFFPVYLALGRIGLIDIDENNINEALDLIREKAGLYNRKTGLDLNPAKKLASDIGDSLPIIYGTDGYLSAVAYRLKCEINENSKTPCWWNEFAELNHNETVGWERLKEVTGKMVLVIFREKDEDIRMKTRIDVTAGLIKGNVSDIIEIQVEGRSKLARALSTLYLGDIASVYLAIASGVDPTPVEKIQSLKAELAGLDQ